MAVGTDRSANQLHIYSEEGVASRPWGGEGLVSESVWMLGLCWNTRPGRCTARGARGRPAPCRELPAPLPVGARRKLQVGEGWRPNGPLVGVQACPSSFSCAAQTEAILGHGGVRSVGRRAGCGRESGPVIEEGGSVLPQPPDCLPQQWTARASSLGSPVTPPPPSTCWVPLQRNVPRTERPCTGETAV